MGSLGSGLGHVASGLGHVAGAVEHVAAPVASGFAHVAAPVANGFVKAAPALGRAVVVAGDVAQTLAEATVIGEIEEGDPLPPTTDEPMESYIPDPTTDLCLDCPDAGNCSSCPAEGPR